MIFWTGIVLLILAFVLFLLGPELLIIISLDGSNKILWKILWMLPGLAGLIITIIGIKIPWNKKEKRIVFGWLLITLALFLSVYANYNCSWYCEGIWGTIYNPLVLTGTALYAIGAYLLLSIKKI